MLDEFEQEKVGSGTDITAFSVWLNRRVTGEQEPDWNGKGRGLRAEEMLTVLLRHVYRYGNFYVRKALTRTDFTSLDDFHYLMSLMFVRPMPVKELISRHIHEKPGGVEIVRRLLKKGMVEMTANDADKRSKVIRVTEKGKASAYSAVNIIKQLNDVICSPLSDDEKLRLIALLQKLDTFHNPVFNEHQGSVFEDIYQAVKGTEEV